MSVWYLLFLWFLSKNLNESKVFSPQMKTCFVSSLMWVCSSFSSCPSGLPHHCWPDQLLTHIELDHPWPLERSSWHQFSHHIQWYNNSQGWRQQQRAANAQIWNTLQHNCSNCWTPKPQQHSHPELLLHLYVKVPSVVPTHNRFLRFTKLLV